MTPMIPERDEDLPYARPNLPVLDCLDCEAFGATCPAHADNFRDDSVGCTHVTYNGGQGCTCSATHERWTQALAVEKDAHREMSAVAAERTADLLLVLDALKGLMKGCDVTFGPEERVTMRQMYPRQFAAADAAIAKVEGDD